MTHEQPRELGICIESCYLALHPHNPVRKRILEIGTLLKINDDKPKRHLISIYNEEIAEYDKEKYICMADSIRKLDNVLFLYLLAMKDKNSRCEFVKNNTLIEYIMNIKVNDKVHAWVDHREMCEYVVIHNRHQDKDKNDNIGLVFQLKSTVKYNILILNTYVFSRTISANFISSFIFT